MGDFTWAYFCALVDILARESLSSLVLLWGCAAHMLADWWLVGLDFSGLCTLPFLLARNLVCRGGYASQQRAEKTLCGVDECCYSIECLFTCIQPPPRHFVWLIRSVLVTCARLLFAGVVWTYAHVNAPHFPFIFCVMTLCIALIAFAVVYVGLAAFFTIAYVSMKHLPRMCVLALVSQTVGQL